MRMPWRKHKDKQLCDIHGKYLQWVWTRKINSDLRQDVQRELDRRGLHYPPFAGDDSTADTKQAGQGVVTEAGPNHQLPLV